MNPQGGSSAAAAIGELVPVFKNVNFRVSVELALSANLRRSTLKLKWLTIAATYLL